MSTDIWPVVHAERRALAADLTGLTPDRWQTPSLCAGWTVHDVLAHMVATAKESPAQFFTGLIGFVGQAVKICVDTTLQECIDDGHRGRVFSVYDTLVNVTFVVALLVAAFVLPPSGISRPAATVLGVLYLVAAATYGEWSRRRPTAPVVVSGPAGSRLPDR